jgi:hypothetical protein
MTRDTRRDRVWRTVLDLATGGVDRDHPDFDGVDGELGPDGVLKQDVLARVDAGDRTVHDVLKTMVEYGFLDEETTRTVVAAPETKQEYQYQRATVYTLAADGPLADSADTGIQTAGGVGSGDATPRGDTDEAGSSDGEFVATRADGTDVALDVDRGEPESADRIVNPDADTPDVDLPTASSPDQLAEWLPEVGEDRAHKLWIRGVTGLGDVYQASVTDLTEVPGIGDTTAERLKVAVAGAVLEERDLEAEDLQIMDPEGIEDIFNLPPGTAEKLVG